MAKKKVVQPDDVSEEEESGEEEEEEEEEVVVPEVLHNIWDDAKVERFTDAGGKKRWKCGWCGCSFGGWNSTKAVAHLTKTRGKDIQVCKSKIDLESKQRYDKLGKKHSKKRDRDGELEEEYNDVITAHNNNAAAALDDRRSVSSSHSGKKRKTGVIPFPRLKSPPLPCVKTPSELSSEVVEVSSSTGRFIQTLVHQGPNPSVESALTMAITDCIHSHGLPFSLAGYPKFRKILHLARCAPSSYVPPDRNGVSTYLLELNYKQYIARNVKLLELDADIFGLTLFGDGATVRKMPLVNILASGVYAPAAVLEIKDCTDRMAEGEKKDARYIAELFKPHMDTLDPNHILVDLLYFDGASNVQKAGRILEAYSPRATTLHGSEHVISLFFQGKPIDRTSTLFQCLLTHLIV
jgi:hypothetical protein